MTSTAPLTEALTQETQRFRSQMGHISRQSGTYFLGTIFTLVLGYGFKVYLARALGVEALGIYALGMTLFGALGIFNSLGLPESTVRFVATYTANGNYRQLHALLWRGGAILFLANILFAAFFLILGRVAAISIYHSPTLVGYLPWFAALMLASALSVFYGKALVGYRDVRRRTVITNFLGIPLMMLLSVILISRGKGLRGYLSAQVLETFVVGIVLLLAVRHLTPLPARFSLGNNTPIEQRIWSFSGAMLGIGVMEFLMGQVDKVALGYFYGPREVGIYSVAAAVVAYIPLALSSVNQIFAPTIADLHTRNERALLSRLFQTLTKWVIALTLPLACVIIVFSHSLMRIFGQDFQAGWTILIIGTVGQLVNCGVGSVGYLLLMSGNEKLLVRVQAAMALVMVVLSVVLVPLWGIVGAAVAAAVTNVGVNAWNLVAVRRILGLSPYNRSYVNLIVPGIVMTAATLLLKWQATAFSHDWIALPFALIVAYLVFGSMVLLFGLNPDDRIIAHAIWSRIRDTAGIKSWRAAA